MRKALRVPCMTIANNAGVDGNQVVAKVENEKGDYGYDALNNEYVNMVQRGIIDPTKVLYIDLRVSVITFIIKRYIQKLPRSCVCFCWCR